MASSSFRQIRFAGIFLIVFLLCGCPTYPAFQDPNIDYNGRWGTWDGGLGPYDDPSIGWDDDPSLYNWYPEYFDDNYGRESWGGFQTR